MPRYQRRCENCISFSWRLFSLHSLRTAVRQAVFVPCGWRNSRGKLYAKRPLRACVRKPWVCALCSLLSAKSCVVTSSTWQQMPLMMITVLPAYSCSSYGPMRVKTYAAAVQVCTQACQQCGPLSNGYLNARGNYWRICSQVNALEC